MQILTILVATIVYNQRTRRKLTIKLVQNDMKPLRGQDGLKGSLKLNITQNKPLFESMVIDQISQIKKENDSKVQTSLKLIAAINGVELNVKLKSIPQITK